MRMVVMMIGIALAGCGKAKPAEPFKGPLTLDLVMSAKDVVKVFEPWDEGFAKLQAKLGAPTKIDGKKHYWAAMAGDDCAYMYVEKEDGKEFHKDGLMVGAIQSPEKYGKGGAIMNRADCLDLVGKGVPAEDPNAPPPPADGSPVPTQTFVTAAVKGRSKWEGKQVKVTGTFTFSSDTAYFDYPGPTKDGPSATLRCVLEKRDSADAFRGKTVIAQGTVKIDKLVTGAGVPMLDASLEHCVLSAP